MEIGNLFLDEGKKRFGNLKTRFSKKKNAYKKATRSGAGSKEAERAETELKRYDFLSWITPFLRLKDTVSNFESQVEENEMEDNFDHESYSRESSSEVAYDDYSCQSPGIARPKSPANHKTKQQTKFSSKKIEQEEYEFMKTIQQALTKEDQNMEDAGDLFGKMVATEMKMMPAHLKFRFKHDVNN